MNGLNNLVRSGKVLYLGISVRPSSRSSAPTKPFPILHRILPPGSSPTRTDTPKTTVSPNSSSTKVAGASLRATSSVRSSPCVARTEWPSLRGTRSAEESSSRRRCVFVLRSSVSEGLIRRFSQDLEARREKGEGLRPFRGTEQTIEEAKISEALEKVGKELGTESVTASVFFRLLWEGARADDGTPSCTCLRYAEDSLRLPHRRRPQDGAPRSQHRGALLPSSSPSRTNRSQQALSLTLSTEQISYLESVIPFDAGFPSPSSPFLHLSRADEALQTRSLDLILMLTVEMSTSSWGRTASTSGSRRRVRSSLGRCEEE